MRLLLPIILLIVGVGAGVGAGLILGESAEEATADPQEQLAADDTYETGESDEYENADEEAPETLPRVEAANENTEYVRLNNQFVVPIVREGSVRSLVVMGITIETQAGQSSIVFTQEPRLRDTFLRVMFAHANTGGFDGIFTEAAAMAPLREGLLEAAEGILGRAVVYDVLITDLTRQDA
ncbi:flagellar basal body-associated FliL family protein [Gymnodinialimonas sp. 2305UL16-5]|uniref:flagellar basal body-associated FliL family protein n=1 Tax=Gymnodinialimonas mytili TaxID=3126503 RepID=UPI0030B6DACE